MPGRHSRSEKGQMSIMMGVMMTTFLLFFAFVVNTGMLVNAKINLQNAADLAAYAGAAVQARQLNHISYLNYEMRRQWKKFLFRIYVLGNMAQDGFPRTGGAQGPMTYVPGSNPRIDYGVPATCVIFNQKDNFCHLDTLPSISIPNAASTLLDQVTETLRGQLQAIEQIRQDNCKAIGFTNNLLNMLWLFNTDPDLAMLITAAQTTSPDQAKVLGIVQGLAYGLGIIPRELILRHRIGTLEKYVNSKPQKNMTAATVEGLRGQSDSSAFERTIQAFYSAYYTLGNHTYPGESIVLDELLPTAGSDTARLLKLNDIKDTFDTYAIDLTFGGPPGGASSADPKDCTTSVNPISISQPVTLGVYKDPNILTYYAIRLTAKANLLFSPFGPLQMKAYSAAQPFGSRIGPKLDANAFTSASIAAVNLAAGSTPVGRIPNLPVKLEDSTARGSGWDNKQVISTMYQFLVAPLGTSVGVITSNDMERAYIPAMAPNPWEASKYNIMSDAGSDRFVKNFGTDLNAAFWAPVFPPGTDRQTISDTLKADVNLLFNSNISGNVGGNGAPGGGVQAIKDNLLQGLDRYISSALPQGNGENGEGVNIVRISNPLMFLTTNGPTPVAAGSGDIISTNPTLIKSSWNTVNDGNMRNDGRVGYSVKFVAFDSLTKKKLSTNGNDSWSNSLGLDSDAELDVPFIKH